MSFEGDGSFAGDGGVMLQKLWEKYRTSWKTTSVPGKYVLKKVGDGFPPTAICEGAGIRSVVPERIKSQKKGEKEISVIELEGGGGLITIENPDGTYQHFLATKSSFQGRRESAMQKIGV